ncbi:uncharacterized protein LOC119740912 [Patiria miniata]|uniref:Uncharacterized protein n=1 Tax=Patiria miniata TaxID=46514 RepID=A0A914B8L3_PATMI|nr:uncharacterized protein LOC119740912 [Patiria miniata]
MEQDAVTVNEQSNKTEKSLKTKEDNIRCAVANITEAVATIVSHSTNDEFRQKCFSLMKVPNSSGLVSSLPSQLHSIACRHMGVTLCAESQVQEFSKSSEKAMVTNSQPAASQCDLQHIPASQPTGADDASLDEDFSDFSQLDFIDGEGVTGNLESSQLFRDEAKSAGTATSGMESVKSFEVSQSKSMLEDEWLDEVLDSDPFFNES